MGCIKYAIESGSHVTQKRFLTFPIKYVILFIEADPKAELTGKPQNPKRLTPNLYMR